VISYTATLATVKNTTYAIGEKALILSINTDTIFLPKSPPEPFVYTWKICYQIDSLENLAYPIDLSLVQCNMDWITYPKGEW
jgi:hypothetical protein